MFGIRIPASLVGIYVVQVKKKSDVKELYTLLTKYRLMSYISLLSLLQFNA